MDLGHGFEDVVLENLLADFVPQIFLRIEFRRVGRQKQQGDVFRNNQLATAVVGSAVEHQQYILPGEPSRQRIEEDLKAGRVRCRHNEIDAGSILRADGTIQIDVFADELRSHFGSDAGRSPAGPRPFHPPDPRLAAKHDAPPPPTPRGAPPRPLYSARKAVFLNASW